MPINSYLIAVSLTSLTLLLLPTISAKSSRRIHAVAHQASGIVLAALVFEALIGPFGQTVHHPALISAALVLPLLMFMVFGYNIVFLLVRPAQK